LAFTYLSQMPYSAISKLSQLLAGNFISDAETVSTYYKNVTEFWAPNLLGVAKPTTLAEAKQVIQIAREENVTLHTITTGMSWGLGSSVAPTTNCLLLSLVNLNKIRIVNESLRYAVIEVGVTQAQLSSYLKIYHPTLTLPVTGSSPHSGILSNALDRGTTFHGHRTTDLKNLEFILASGELYRTGFWETATGSGTNNEELHYAQGMGPDYTGLFVQSNLGIVTAGVVELQAKPEALRMVWATLPGARLPQFIEASKSLYRNSILTRIIHVGNNKRMKIKGGAYNPADDLWTVMTAIQGTEALVDVKSAAVKAAYQDILEDLRFVTRYDDLSREPILTQMLDLHEGTPSTVFIQAMYKSEEEAQLPNGYNVDSGKIGMMCCLPIVPMEGKRIEEVVVQANSIAARFGFTLASTVNPINDVYAEFVLNLYFDRSSPAETLRAHECNTAMHSELATNGVRFYRLDLNEQKNRQVASGSHPLSEMLKNTLDPTGRLSPGKYGVQEAESFVLQSKYSSSSSTFNGLFSTRTT
jgi:4-cresol dehydrogenase (hydroxylating) flavoprotein subunit